MNNLSKADLNGILAAADAVISAIAGENEDVHPDNTSKMIGLWDDLNDRHAPPEIVKALVSELLARREAEGVPVGFRWRHETHNYQQAWTYVYHRSPDEFEKQNVVQMLFTSPPLPVVPDIPKYELSIDFTDYHAGWNACRAYALNAASFRELDNSSTKHFRENFETSTNSPVTPDCWALVPIDATPEMLNASWIHYGIHSPGAWRTMIAAAPKPE